MSRAEALKSYTWNGAFAAKEETLKGSIAVGKLADITVLSKDIMTVPEDEIPRTAVTYTIVGGKVAYLAPVRSGERSISRPQKAQSNTGSNPLGQPHPCWRGARPYKIWR